MNGFTFSIHQLPGGVILADSKGLIADVNKKTTELLGYTEDEIIGKSIFRFASPEDKTKLECIINPDTTLPYTKIEVEFLTKTNEKLTLEIRWNWIALDNSDSIIFQVQNVTHFKRVNDELNEQRRLHKTLVHNLPGMVFRCNNDRNWTMEYISSHCLELTGYRPEEIIGNQKISFNDIIHPNHRERVWAKWQEVLAVQSVFIDEYPIITASGGEKWVWEQGVGVFCSNNKLIAIEGIIIDISERKKNDETLRFQAGLLDQIGDLITATDLQGRIIFVNQAETKLTGKLKEQLLGQKVDIYGEDSTKGAVQNEIIEKTLNHGEWRGEVVNNDKDGKRVTLDCRTWVVKDQNEKPIALCGISTDITERKIAEEALRLSEEKFRSLVDNAFDAIYLMRNRCYEYANQGFTDITGYSLSELTSTSFDFDVLLTEKSKKMVEERYMARKAGEKIPNHYELQIKTKNSEIKEVEVSTVSLSREGEVVVLGIMRDITDRKRSELALLESQHKLKKQNDEYYALNEELIETNERIQEINRELVIAKDKAEESEKLKSAFLANMSHEVRTPMNGILGFSQLIQNPELSYNERNEYVSIIQNCGTQLLSIINDLIDISKIQSNLISLKLSPVNLNELLNEQFLLFKPKSDSFGLELTLNNGLKNEQCTISTDGTRLRQVLTNLIGNALKFTTKGHVRFGYIHRGSVLEFYIEDTGVGIPHDKHQFIFDRFRQVETDLSRQSGGTGLGLAISKALINKMGGNIWVESNPGKGSTFLFTLPYNPVYKDVELIGRIDEIRYQNLNVTKNILIAEDNEINYLYLKQLLSSVDAKFTWVTNGLDAIETVRNNPSIDLVLMDIKMPIMDGYEATRELKKMRKNLPIIAQTAYAFESDREKALEAGCDDYISKPINREKFIEKVVNYLK